MVKSVVCLPFLPCVSLASPLLLTCLSSPTPFPLPCLSSLLSLLFSPLPPLFTFPASSFPIHCLSLPSSVREKQSLYQQDGGTRFSPLVP
ncbi:unnamed protein product [Closterium sp. Naga37s-1]|nr:unnamed protein product [Closterium sp. Naga37s-1]